MKRLLLIALLVLSSCSLGRGKVKPVFLRSFVMSYHELRRITISRYRQEKLVFDIRFEASQYYQFNSAPGEQLDRYNALCEKHNDMAYNQTRWVSFPYEPHCARDFACLEIMCASDWDDDHPAGCSLGDIVRFRSRTPWPYIRSGYKQKYSDGEDGEYYPVDRLVSELTPDDMTLLPARGIALQFQQPPASPGPKTLTVRMTTDDGEVFEASGTFEF